MKKAEFQKVINSIRKDYQIANACKASFPKAMMTSAQQAKGTATVNCGGEWYSYEGTKKIAFMVMTDERFKDLLSLYNATAKMEINQFGTIQIRINYEIPTLDWEMSVKFSDGRCTEFAFYTKEDAEKYERHLIRKLSDLIASTEIKHNHN